MKAKHNHRERLQKVRDYLRSSYADVISIEMLQALSHFSYRNLQRIFKGLYGETIGAYVTRLKVENCAKQLLFTQNSITDIAYEVGYSDVQALSKSFKKHFGISPTAYRERKELILSKAKQESDAMPFIEDRIEILEEKRVMYITAKGDYESSDIDVLWERLETIISIENITTINNESFGVIWDDPIITETIKCNYDACVTIPDAEKNVKKKYVKNIVGGRYAVFIHIGSYETISSTYDKIFGQWIFQTNEEVGTTPFLEFYRKHKQHTENKEAYVTEIYVPLKD